MSKHRAILIDVTKRLISEIEIESGLEAIYKNIGCELFAVAGDFNEDTKKHLADSLLVDDEGLLTPGKPLFTFTPPGWTKQMKYAGNGLITGIDYNTGETTSCRIPLLDIATYVEWTNEVTA